MDASTRQKVASKRQRQNGSLPHPGFQEEDPPATAATADATDSCSELLRGSGTSWPSGAASAMVRAAAMSMASLKSLAPARSAPANSPENASTLLMLLPSAATAAPCSRASAGSIS